MDRRRLLVRVVVRPRVDGREVHEDGQDRAEQGADGYITVIDYGLAKILDEG